METSTRWGNKTCIETRQKGCFYTSLIQCTIRSPCQKERKKTTFQAGYVPGCRQTFCAWWGSRRRGGWRGCWGGGGSAPGWGCPGRWSGCRSGSAGGPDAPPPDLTAGPGYGGWNRPNKCEDDGSGSIGRVSDLRDPKTRGSNPRQEHKTNLWEFFRIKSVVLTCCRCAHLLFLSLLKAFAHVNCTGSPQGFSLNQIWHTSWIQFTNTKLACFTNVKQINKIRKLAPSVLFS